VVSVNARPAAFAAALARGDFEGAGRLMNESHASLRDLYDVSSPELEALTGRARAHPACYGARLTGAGFGGCAVALVRSSLATGFVSSVGAAWRDDRPDLASSVFIGRPGAGARLVD
jgi:galactokinase